jgi:para-aminobenzoate synthetase component 1
MKGTIDASLPDAERIILDDYKEKAEHATIVDLIRNDLSRVADEVEVKRYRYVERLTTHHKDLLQVSSEISGKLPDGFRRQLGDILFSMLPAGSICGAPKPKTLEIIEHAEGYERDFYTGIFGWFDGRNFDSAVMIRFAEPASDGLTFKSGGGITSQSDLEKEYEELVHKVYVPLI